MQNRRRMAGEHCPNGDVTPMLRLLSALAVTVVLGLASRLYPVGWFLWDRVLGEVLYAVAAYLAPAVHYTNGIRSRFNGQMR